MILIIDCGSKKTKEIVKVLDEAGFKNKTVAMRDLLLRDYNDFSGIIISGAPLLLTEVDVSYHLNKFEFIKKLSIPLLGICFGHQIIGLLFGSKIMKGKEVREEQDIEAVVPNKLFRGLDRTCSFTEDHCEYIDLPDNFILLAKSNTCEVEAMKHKDKEIYGVQFHPEVSDENGRKLLVNFCDICLSQS